MKIIEGGRKNKFQTGDVHLLELAAVDDDQIEGLHYGKLEIICNKGTYTERKYSKVIKIRDNDLEGTGSNDPHFSQAVYDSKSHSSKFICYDITTDSDKILNIFTHSPTKTYLYGILKDDYYMHIIKIISALGNITATVTELSLPNNNKIKWSLSTVQDFYNGDFYEITIFKNCFEIVLDSDEPNNFMKFLITKHNHSVLGHFLNIQVIGLKSYRYTGGLLGRVGNNRFEFHEPIQDNTSNNGNSRGSISINRHIHPSKIKKNQDNLCWYLEIQDLLHPLSIKDFLQSNI